MVQIEELEAKLAGEETLSFSSVKEEPVVSDAETKAAAGEEVESRSVLIYKDGSSDSSGLNVENAHRLRVSSPQKQAPTLPAAV